MTTKTVLIAVEVPEGQYIDRVVLTGQYLRTSPVSFRVVTPQPQPAMRVPEGFTVEKLADSRIVLSDGKERWAYRNANETQQDEGIVYRFLDATLTACPETERG